MALLTHESWQDISLKAFLTKAWIQARRRGRMPGFETATETLKAFVNHGRWIVQCPNGCGTAICPSTIERYFVCITCGTVAYHVEFPKVRDMVAIELVLEARARLETRNWNGTETIAELRAENRARGV